ncbi:MAG: TatD family hydrolase [Anaerolineales bacterium]|nr:TatD family hydrolase [Anaerolineales bacterium]
MRLVDSHCHLDFRDFDGDREAALERAAQAGVQRIIIPAVDLQTSRAGITLANQHALISCAVGVHPNSATTWQARTPGELRDLAGKPGVVAIGEIGLDYYRDRAPRSLQLGVLRAQLDLAVELGRPVIIHTRNASEQARDCMSDTLEVLSAYQGRLSGVLHSFSGNLEEAQQALALGFMIGITGPVTFKKAVELRQVVAALPLEQLLVETDAPFLSPHPLRGKRNEPAYVRHVVEKIAEIHQRSPEEVANKTSENARRLFQWSS